MAIIRVKKDKDNPYVMINKTPLNDDCLSWKAKGLLSYLLSLPDDWAINIEDLKKRSKDGKDGTTAGIKELMKAGYITRDRKRIEGKFKGYDYTVHEISPKPEKPSTAKPITENPSILNNDLTNIKREEKKDEASASYHKELLKKYIDKFDKGYKKLYRESLDFNGKEIGQLKLLCKKPPDIFSRKLQLFYKKCKEDRSDFWKFTPSKLNHCWNDLTLGVSKYKTLGNIDD